MKKGYNLLHVIIIIFFTAIISAITTGVIFMGGTSSRKKSTVALATDENIQEFLEVYAKLQDDYYEDVNKEEMIQSAIDGMMKYFNEKYTTYLDEDAASALMQELNGKYTGIGITIRGNEIIDVLDSSPASKSGVVIGDKIISVNGENVTETPNAKISALIKENNDNVVLEIERDENILTFTMRAEELDMPSVSARMVDGTDIGIIEISIFSVNLTTQVENSISDLRAQGMNKLILDLRGNTGGYLEQANSVASLFLEKGQTIYYLEDKKDKKVFVDETEAKQDIPVVILVNGGTASAAEILTTALKDSYGATIVGKTTYGKGKVQHTVSLQSGDVIKYTSSKWLRPNGECIDGYGILPDYNIDNEYIYDESNPEVPIIVDIIDRQLEKAIELLNS